MLANLHVKNLALIEEADINFKDGLNILTGETGAGKSIILGSVNLALGGKAVSDLIRSGADYALTELSFDIESEAVKEKLTAFGVEELEEGQLIISRKITPTRSQIKVNGQTYTLGQVREMASWLIDIHGQHDNQLLLNESHHIDILDAYAKESLAEVKAALKEVYAAYVKQKQELQAQLDLMSDIQAIADRSERTMPDRSNISRQIQRNRSTARKQESVSLMDLLTEQQEDDFDAR